MMMALFQHVGDDDAGASYCTFSEMVIPRSTSARLQCPAPHAAGDGFWRCMVMMMFYRPVAFNSGCGLSGFTQP